MHSSVMVTGMASKISQFNSESERNWSVPIRFLSKLRAGFFHRKSVESVLNRSDSDNISVESACFSKFGPIHSERKYGIWPRPFNSCEMSRKTLHPIKESTKQVSTEEVRVSDRNRPTPVPITGLQPVFTETFNVTQEARTYNRFIERLRSRLESGRFAGHVPMLNPELDGRNRWFDVVLMSGNSQITVRFRLGDLYLVAFQGANGQWYEFQPQNNQDRLFSDTVLLPYTSDYPTNRDSFQRHTVVGPNPLARAISSLADPNFNTGNRDNRQLLVNLMIMFPEALRFRTVSDFVHERMINPDRPDLSINPEIDRLVHNWGALSLEMRRSDLFASFHELPELSVRSVAEVYALLGLLLWSNKTPTPRNATPLRAHMVTSEGRQLVEIFSLTSKGRQLVEIFSVQILNIDNEDPGDLYGTIQVVDGLSTPQYIFDRTKNNYLSIRPKEYVPLTGPTRAISAFDSFYIDVSLLDHDMVSWDDEVSKGLMSWNYFADNVYDQPLSVEVKGKYGSIAVSYAVYSNAVTATVQVKLINGDNENPANVYGIIQASNTLSNVFIPLFNKDSKNYVDIKPQELIPLLRSVVVVPLTSSIKVVADLWDQDTLSPDDPIAQGSVTFAAADSGSNTGRINGKYGVVEVKVTWSSSWA